MDKLGQGLLTLFADPAEGFAECGFFYERNGEGAGCAGETEGLFSECDVSIHDAIGLTIGVNGGLSLLAHGGEVSGRGIQCPA